MVEPSQQQRAADYMREHPEAPVQQVAEATGLSKSAINNARSRILKTSKAAASKPAERFTLEAPVNALGDLGTPMCALHLHGSNGKGPTVWLLPKGMAIRAGNGRSLPSAVLTWKVLLHLVESGILATD